MRQKYERDQNIQQNRYIKNKSALPFLSKLHIYQDLQLQGFLHLSLVLAVSFRLMLTVLLGFPTPSSAASCTLPLLAYYIRRNYFIEFRQV